MGLSPSFTVNDSVLLRRPPPGTQWEQDIKPNVDPAVAEAVRHSFTSFEYLHRMHKEGEPCYTSVDTAFASINGKAPSTTSLLRPSHPSAMPAVISPALATTTAAAAAVSHRTFAAALTATTETISGPNTGHSLSSLRRGARHDSLHRLAPRG